LTVVDFWVFALVVAAMVLTVVVSIVDTLLLARWEETAARMSADEIRTLKHLGGPIWVWLRRKLRTRS
jgi:hypothetical protein